MVKTLYILVLTADTSSFAFAQGAIAGSVKAGSGVPLLPARRDRAVGLLNRRRQPGVLLAIDHYNALNSSAALSHNLAFVPGGTWPQPLTIMTPRLFKITSEVDF